MAIRPHPLTSPQVQDLIDDIIEERSMLPTDGLMGKSHMIHLWVIPYRETGWING